MLRTVLTMSFYGSLAGLAALALSLGMRHIRASRGVVLAVWALAGLRLLCPLELTSGFSVWQTAPWTQTVQTEQKAPTGGGAQAQIVQDGTAPSTEKGQTQGVGAVSLTSILTTVWAGGMGLLLLWGGVSYVLFRRRLRFAVRLEKSVYEVDTVSTPCVAGFLRPKVYLPVGLTELQRRYTVAHERAHIRNGDHLWKLASYLILSIHWFNPLVWVQYRRFQQDLEMACDERVLKGLGVQARADYSEALLALAKRQRAIVPSPIAFGENTTKERITGVLRRKKPLAAVTVLALLGSVLLTACLASGPAEPMAPETPTQPIETVEPVETTAPEAPPEDTAGTSQPLVLGSSPASSIYGKKNQLLFSLYVADPGVSGKILSTEDSYYPGRLDYVLSQFSWEQTQAPQAQPDCSWLSLSDPEGSCSLTYYDSGDPGLLCLRDGGEESYWTAGKSQNEDFSAVSLWHVLRAESDNLELSAGAAPFSAADATDAAAYFAETAYGEMMLGLTPGSTYEITQYQLMERADYLLISEDGRAVVGGMTYGVKPVDYAGTDLWAGNTRGGEGEYQGWLVMERQFCLQRQEDGLWHCVEMGTGGVGLPE